MIIPRRVFLKQVGLGTAGLSLAAGAPDAFGSPAATSGNLPRSSPEEQGVDSAAILGFLDALRKSGLEVHSFMMVRHGQVIAEGWWSPYRPDLNHMLYSLSKSFTSTAVGLAAKEGKLSVDDSVISFFPADLPPAVSPNLTALKIKHLLTMSVGHTEDSTPKIKYEQNWVKAFLALPIPQLPGSLFLYNSGATYILSAIVQKVTGMKLIDYLTPRLFQPLAIREMTWETCPLGINTGGWGLAIQTESIAKFGLLYLQKGRWNGEQLVPASWVEEATSFKIQQPAKPGENLDELKRTDEWHQGYCYQFWRSRHNAYRADGAFGQFSIVIPQHDAVIAMTSESSSMGEQMSLIWEHLLPAMQPQSLPPRGKSLSELKARLAHLALLPPKATPTSPVAEQISGKTFHVEPNSLDVQSVTFTLVPGQCQFVLVDKTGEYPITCGVERWIDGKTSMPGTPPKLSVGKLAPIQPILASATWRDKQTLEMTWRFYDTPHHDTVTCHFDGSRVSVNFMSSISQLQPDHTETRPVLEGKLAA
jgi:CubicO group peptidase (beta-lactamase class C family)